MSSRCEHLERDNWINVKYSFVKNQSDLGTSIDGFIALAAHTVVAKADKAAPVEGKKADVILAAYQALQAALRTLKPGFTNTQVSFWGEMT